MANPPAPKPLRVRLTIFLIIAMAVVGIVGKPWIVHATGIDKESVSSRLEWTLVLAVAVAAIVFYLRSKAKNKPHA